MLAYLARRALVSVATLLFLTAAVYLAINLLPGAGFGRDDDAFIGQQQPRGPLLAGYARWLSDAAAGDLGRSVSVRPGRSVVELLAAALPHTLRLGLLAFLFTILLSIPLAVLGARWPVSAPARASSGLLYALHALPVFFVAIALQQIVAGRMKLLPVLGAAPVGSGAGGFTSAGVAHLILPALSLALGSLAFLISFTRGALLASLSSAFARAARARGASEWRVLLSHGMAGAAVPLISAWALLLPGVISGSILIEKIFALPGIGGLFLAAASLRDYPLLMSISLVTAAATLAAALAADLLYFVADPRIRDSVGPETFVASPS